MQIAFKRPLNKVMNLINLQMCILKSRPRSLPSSCPQKSCSIVVFLLYVPDFSKDALIRKFCFLKNPPIAKFNIHSVLLKVYIFRRGTSLDFLIIIINMKYSSIVPNTLVHQCIECIFGWVSMQTSQHGFHSIVTQIQPYLSEIPKELQNLMLKMAEKHLGASQVDSWVSKMGDFLGLGFHTNGMTQVQTSDIPKELQDLLIKMAEKNLSKY